MPYSYNANDGDASVTAGTAGLTFAGVIQSPDAYGGYNVHFTIPGSLEYYHVHFHWGGSRVSVIRYFSGAGVQGNNIIKNTHGDSSTFAELARDCSGYANHFILLTNFRNAIQGLPRAPNNNLA